MFINTLVRSDIVEDRKERIALCLEFNQAGVIKVFDKMERLNHEHINLAIQKFRDDVEADTIQEDMEDYANLDSVEVCEMLFECVQGTPSFSNLHNILCYLLKIQDNPDKR